MQTRTDLARGWRYIRRAPLVYFGLSLIVPLALVAAFLIFGLQPGRYQFSMGVASAFAAPLLLILLAGWGFYYFTMMAAVRQNMSADGSTAGFLKVRPGPLLSIPLAVVLAILVTLLAMIPIFLVQWLVLTEMQDALFRGAMLGAQRDPAYFVSFAFLFSFVMSVAGLAIGSYVFAGFMAGPVVSGMRDLGVRRAFGLGARVAAAVRGRIFMVLFVPMIVTEIVVMGLEFLFPYQAVALGLTYVSLLTMFMLPMAALVAIVGEQLESMDSAEAEPAA